MAVDYFLKIDGIDGESQDTGHPNELQLLSWSWGESNSGSAGTGTGQGAGKVNMQDFSFMIYNGKASTKVMLACAVGTHIPTATLSCRKAGGTPEAPGVEYFKITFTKVLISSYQISAATEIPTEAISFNFQEVAALYRPQGDTGEATDNLNFKWNVATNTGSA